MSFVHQHWRELCKMWVHDDDDDDVLSLFLKFDTDFIVMIKSLFAIVLFFGIFKSFVGSQIQYKI